MASLSVGCGKTVAIRSSSVASSVMASAKPWIISVTLRILRGTGKTDYVAIQRIAETARAA